MMKKALCNASVDAKPVCKEHGSMHICANEKDHKHPVHMCSCGMVFVGVKKSAIDQALRKAQ